MDRGECVRGKLEGSAGEGCDCSTPGHRLAMNQESIVLHVLSLFILFVFMLATLPAVL